MTVPSDRVAVVGCGSSTLISELIDGGYTAIVAIDVAQSALEQLRTSLGGSASQVSLVRADARTVRLPNMVGLWHDRATFHFLTDEVDQQAYALSAAKLVRPGGHLVMAEFATDGPISCSGLPVHRHSASSLQTVFAEGFELTDSFEQDHVTPSGAIQRFVHVVMIRRNRAQ